MSNFGEITVIFSMELLNPDVFNQSRHLTTSKFYDTLTKSMKLEVMPGTNYQDPDNLNFTYHVASVKNKTMIVKLDFAEPAYISSAIRPD